MIWWPSPGAGQARQDHLRDVQVLLRPGLLLVVLDPPLLQAAQGQSTLLVNRILTSICGSHPRVACAAGDPRHHGGLQVHLYQGEQHRVVRSTGGGGGRPSSSLIQAPGNSRHCAPRIVRRSLPPADVCLSVCDDRNEPEITFAECKCCIPGELDPLNAPCLHGEKRKCSSDRTRV